MCHSSINRELVAGLPVEVLPRFSPNEYGDDAGDDQSQEPSLGRLLFVSSVRLLGLQQVSESARLQQARAARSLTFLKASNATSGGGLAKMELK